MSDLDRYSPEHDTPIPCDRCRGKGKINGVFCGRCRGAGERTVSGFEAEKIRKEYAE